MHHAEAIDHMRAIDPAMQRYIESRNWRCFGAWNLAAAFEPPIALWRIRPTPALASDVGCRAALPTVVGANPGASVGHTHQFLLKFVMVGGGQKVLPIITNITPRTAKSVPMNSCLVTRSRRSKKKWAKSNVTSGLVEAMGETMTTSDWSSAK